MAGMIYARPLDAAGQPVGDWTLVGETDGDFAFTFDRIYEASLAFTLNDVDGYRVEDLLWGREPTPIFYGVVADLGDPTRRAERLDG